MGGHKTVPVTIPVISQPRKVLVLTGAYGRKASLDDWRRGLDFYILVTNGISGSYCSIRDTEQIKAAGYTHIALLGDRCIPVCEPLHIDGEFAHVTALAHLQQTNSEGTH